MNVTYSERAKQSLALLQRASKNVEEVIGPSADTIKAEWDRTLDDKGRLLYTLRIADWTDSVTGSFAPDELESRSQMGIRLHYLWGKLLQARNDRQLQALSESVE